ncbi:MAG TPA: T9SS type A sorting domain-containing protein, partial [Ignavibacteriales bacterium]|nr:T9SS type A sorting domain-containing protein [Ignavibacteriales bacterium]
VASYLNFTSATDLGTFVLGDLLNTGSFASSQIIGAQSNSATMTLGDINRAQLYKVDIMNTDTWDVSTAENLVGVNYFSIPGDNAAYYLLTNLNKDGHACKVRLSFKTTNGANFLKNYVLTNAQDYGRLYAKNAVILADVPQDGINILRIVNTNTNEYNEFPKGSRFGVARTANNITTLHLDLNFSSQVNVPEEVIVNTGINAEVISLYNKDVSTGKIYTDFATFRVLNYSYNGTTSMQIEFKKYLQNNDGTFTAQSSATYVVPRPNAASTAYKVKSLSYDSDNDGIDEMGYCIAYNNRYFIYTFNGTGFTQRKVFPGSTPSTAPEYFNLDATVLAAKWSGYSTIYIYNPANHCFYLDKDRDLQINLTTEKQPMGNWFANWSPMPYTGDWYGDATWEYGTYEFDKPYSYTQFNINHSHTDGWSWFEFPYGDGYPTDKALVWKPRTLSAPKSAGEAAEEAAEIPSEYSISQNFPNPFNPATTIRFALPAESRVTLDVFNILGERVAELVNDVRPAGTMDVRFDGSNLASGIYIYKFNATSLENGKHFQKINKMMLIK